MSDENEIQAEHNDASKKETTTAINHQLLPKQNRTRAIVVGSLLLLSALCIGLFIFLGGTSQNGAGRPVPAPRDTSFIESNTGNAIQFTGEQTVMIDPEQVSRAGIKIETVGEALGGETAMGAATGVVQPNAYRETPIISILGGVVRQTRAELGQNVQRGQTIAVIFSEEYSAAQARYLGLLTELETSRKNYEREAKLVNVSSSSRGELDEATAKLKTTQAELDEHHKHHERITKLISVGAASREELEQATTKLKTAEADLDQSRNRYERAVKLAEINPVSRNDFEQAAVKLRNAESELAATKQKLLLYGFSPQRVGALRSTSQISSEIAVVAPAPGTITVRSINQGEIIEANKELFRVTDLSSVWIVAQIYEKDLAGMRQGSGVSVTTDAYPNQVFRGRVAYLAPEINQNTRTAQVRIELDNPGQLLKIGMYVNVAFGATGAAEKTAPVVPASAVQNINNQQTVFIIGDKPNIFVLHSVKLAPESNGFYKVLEGATVGDRIVTEGSFLLRAEWLKQHPGGR
jgi:RND family efflux transporter MFP subunit